MKLDLLCALEILSQVQKKHPEAIIAGGFLRDLYFGKEFKDIDIFLNSNLTSVSPSSNFVSVNSHNLSYSTDGEITEVQYFHWYNDDYSAKFEINLIEVNVDSVVSRVQEHDFDFCQVWTDGKEIHGVEILQQVQQTKEVTLVQCENSKQLERSLRRWDRFQEKYPGFSLKYKEVIYLE